jgi:frataxin-like iron-binding protein CyaY
VQTSRGKYTVRPDHEKKILVLQSYISGYHNYYFDPTEKLWFSVKDNHDFRGLFTRDIVRHCVGCPHFD